MHEFDRKLAVTLHGYENMSQELSELKETHDMKCSIIKNMQIAQSTLKSLVEDKDEVIRSQGDIIEGLQNNAECEVKLKEANTIISLRERELAE